MFWSLMFYGWFAFIILAIGAVVGAAIWESSQDKKRRAKALQSAAEQEAAQSAADEAAVDEDASGSEAEVQEAEPAAEEDVELTPDDFKL
jgi:hypothetical protein